MLNVELSGNTWIDLVYPQSQAVCLAFLSTLMAAAALRSSSLLRWKRSGRNARSSASAYLIEKEFWTALKYYPNLPQAWDQNCCRLLAVRLLPTGWSCIPGSVVWLDTQLRLELKIFWQWGGSLFWEGVSPCLDAGNRPRQSCRSVEPALLQQCCHHVTALGQAQICHL